MSEQKVSGKTITHAWFRTTEMFKDDSVIGIAKQEWDDLDTRIFAAATFDDCQMSGVYGYSNVWWATPEKV